MSNYYNQIKQALIRKTKPIWKIDVTRLDRNPTHIGELSQGSRLTQYVVHIQPRGLMKPSTTKELIVLTGENDMDNIASFIKGMEKSNHYYHLNQRGELYYYIPNLFSLYLDTGEHKEILQLYANNLSKFNHCLGTLPPELYAEWAVKYFNYHRVTNNPFGVHLDQERYFNAYRTAMREAFARGHKPIFSLDGNELIIRGLSVFPYYAQFKLECRGNEDGVIEVNWLSDLLKDKNAEDPVSVFNKYNAYFINASSREAVKNSLFELKDDPFFEDILEYIDKLLLGKNNKYASLYS